jgi:hypothetical protein
MNYKYAIIYTGAPYGDTESGHIVSRHITLETACRRYREWYTGRTGELNHTIVRLNPDGSWSRAAIAKAGATS